MNTSLTCIIQSLRRPFRRVRAIQYFEERSLLTLTFRGAADGTPVNGWENNGLGIGTKNKNQLWRITRA